jgi:hypothetical protein
MIQGPSIEAPAGVLGEAAAEAGGDALAAERLAFRSKSEKYTSKGCSVRRFDPCMVRRPCRLHGSFKSEAADDSTEHP